MSEAALQTKPIDNTDAIVSADPKEVPTDIGIKPCIPAIAASAAVPEP